MVARDCMLALRSGATVVIQHISSGNSVELVRTAKKLGADIHAEATPHHFTLTEGALLEHGTLAKMNPPLRTEKDRQEIIHGLKDGTIDLIATDHAPHSEEEKAKPLTEAPSGITGLETSLGLGITSLVKEGYLSLMELLEKMTCNPAFLYKLPGGVIQVNAPADFVSLILYMYFCSFVLSSEIYHVPKNSEDGGERQQNVTLPSFFEKRKAGPLYS